MKRGPSMKSFDEEILLASKASQAAQIQKVKKVPVKEN
jgi:hypothetical protein